MKNNNNSILGRNSSPPFKTGVSFRQLDEIIVATKVEVEPGAAIEAIRETTNITEQKIREKIPYAKYIFIEPDLRSTT